MIFGCSSSVNLVRASVVEFLVEFSIGGLVALIVVVDRVEPFVVKRRVNTVEERPFHTWSQVIPILEFGSLVLLRSNQIEVC